MQSKVHIYLQVEISNEKLALLESLKMYAHIFLYMFLWFLVIVRIEKNFMQISVSWLKLEASHLVFF